MARAAREGRERDESPARENLREHALALASGARRMLDQEKDAEARALLEAKVRKYEALATIENLKAEHFRPNAPDQWGRTNPAERAWRAALASLKHYEGPALRDRKRYAGVAEPPAWLREQYVAAFGEDSAQPTDGWLRHIAQSDAFHTQALLARDQRMSQAKAALLKALRDRAVSTASREVAE